MTRSTAAVEHLLAFADDEHMVGARHTSWIGLGPFLEEDLAFCSIAQDELGHAVALYQLVLDIEPAADRSGDHRADHAIDEFAMLRAPSDYRSCWLAEVECADWSDALVRHWLYDRAEALRWDALVGSSDRAVAETAARALREEAFHTAHAEQFMTRMTRTADRTPIAGSVRRLLPVATGIWDPSPQEGALVEDGFLTATSEELAQRWRSAIEDDLGRWGLDIGWPAPDDVAAQLRAQQGRRARSAGFDAFLDDLQRVLSIDPTATW
jgi:ring-1,2-phenylacetyl-CoA epoxidase subunit PaaC